MVSTGGAAAAGMAGCASIEGVITGARRKNEVIGVIFLILAFSWCLALASCVVKFIGPPPMSFSQLLQRRQPASRSNNLLA